MDILDKFWKELDIGEIHLRDKWQFELKSEFRPLPKMEKSYYTQELFLFIPNSLHINDQTYSKEDFYIDQTNLIRYKTPIFKLTELFDPKNELSPLTRLSSYDKETNHLEDIRSIKFELKLFGNILRSSLRFKVLDLVQEIGQPNKDKKLDYLEEKIDHFCNELSAIRQRYFEIQEMIGKIWNNPDIKQYLYYVDEFVSKTIEYYCLGLLSSLRKHTKSTENIINKKVSHLILTEKEHRHRKYHEKFVIDEDTKKDEFILYRTGLLNKFVLDALLLRTSRASLDKRYRNIVGGISAGIAMMIYLLLFIWQGNVFVINSAPFVVITVVLYILKDRLKEGMKSIWFQQAFKLLPDYVTDILSSEDETVLGKLKESFSFIKPSDLSKDIINIRNQEFHTVLEKFKRPERIIYYKKEIHIQKNPPETKGRRHDLNIISRLNIDRFLRKASNAYEEYFTMNSETHKIESCYLPKVYHLNIIMRNTYFLEDYSEKVELKKFRLILDKNGIKHLEKI